MVVGRGGKIKVIIFNYAETWDTLLNYLPVKKVRRQETVNFNYNNLEKSVNHIFAITLKGLVNLELP
jgi:hypothetical protein